MPSSVSLSEGIEFFLKRGTKDGTSYIYPVLYPEMLVGINRTSVDTNGVHIYFIPCNIRLYKELKEGLGSY